MNSSNSEKKYFEQYEQGITTFLCRALLYMCFVCPAIIAADIAGFFALDVRQMIAASCIILFACAVPTVLKKSNINLLWIKYYIVFAVSILVFMLSCVPHVGVWITYILGISLSLLYLDLRLTFSVIVFDYMLMLVSIYIRVSGWLANKALIVGSSVNRSVMNNFIGYAIGLTIEYAIICPVFLMFVKYQREHLQREEKLFVDLSAEEERYRLALENSSDVLFEYDYAVDELRYYGSFTRNAGHTSEKNKPRIISHYCDCMLAAGRVFPEDVQKVMDFKNGRLTDQFDMRLRVGDDSFYWITVEGTIVNDHGQPARLVGKMRDITAEKQHEQSLLENSQKDAVTNFYTWDVGSRILEQRYGKNNDKRNTEFMLLKICNMDSIDERFGIVFSDAIISRISEVIWELTREQDLKIRLSRSTFVVLMADTTMDGISLFQTSLERSLQHIYTGEESMSGLDYFIRFYHNFDELTAAVPDEEKTTSVHGDEASEYMSDIVSFAFNMLEHTKDLPSAMKMLMERIGTQFNVAYMHVFERDTVPGLETCMYEWVSAHRDNDVAQGQKIETDRMDQELIYSSLSHNDYVILDDRMLAQMTEKTRERYTENHTSYLIIAFISDGEVVGNIAYEHLNPEYRWPDSTLSALVEVTRVMSSYILKNKSDNASKAKSNFLSSMSHEIRTPMNAIAGFSELILSEHDLNDTTRKYAVDIKTSADNLLSIINDILDFSKIESGKFEIIPDRYLVSSVLNDITSIIRMRLEEKNVSFRISYETAIPEGLIGDASRVRQILLNILNNAVKFTEHGEITLTLKWEDQEKDRGIMRASVKDTGIGIKKEDLGKLFNSFSQVDTVRNKSIAGTGLGLAICRNLCHLMGGEIEVDSVYGEGSTFSFYLPQGVYDHTACCFDTDRFERVEEAVFHVPFIAPEARLLIVDDNRVNLEVAKGLLGQYGSKIFTAVSGEESLEIFRKDQNFDIIFMDYMMPKMDGIEATALIRRMNVPHAADVPIVALTANAIKGVEKQFLDAGMNDYVSKPIELKALARVMDKWIPDRLKRAYTDAAPEPERVQDNNDGEGDLEGLEGVDVKEGLKNCLGNRDSYTELLKTFVSADTMGDADRFLSAGDIDNYRITVHGLKSAANYIGAAELSAYAKQLENYSRDKDTEAINENHPGLRPLYERTSKSIIKTLGLDRPEAEKPDSEKRPITAEELEQQLTELEKSLQDMELDAAGNKCRELDDRYFDNSEIMGLIHEAAKNTDNFDFDEAEEKVTKALKILQNKDENKS